MSPWIKLLFLLNWAAMRKCNAMIMVFLLLTILSLCKASTLIFHEKEKQALLSIKHALTDPTNRLSSWSVNEDCCGWTWVHCDNVSGWVVELHLGNWNDPSAIGPYGILGGKISHALLELQFLSYNDFGGTPIPSFLGSMQSLNIPLPLQCILWWSNPSSAWKSFQPSLSCSRMLCCQLWALCW